MILALWHLNLLFKRMKDKTKSHFTHVTTPFNEENTITVVIWDKDMLEKQSLLSEERLRIASLMSTGRRTVGHQCFCH